MTRKKSKPAIKVLLLVRPRKVPSYWPTDHKGAPVWATVSSSKSGDADGCSSGFFPDQAIDARFASDLVRSWKETYDSSYIIRLVTIQAVV